MADDDLVTQEAKASAYMIFTMMNQINSVLARSRLNLNHILFCFYIDKTILHRHRQHIIVLLSNYSPMFQSNDVCETTQSHESVKETFEIGHEHMESWLYPI